MLYVIVVLLVYYIIKTFWFKHALLARTVDIIKQMLTILKLLGLEWKQHAYRIPFLRKHLTVHLMSFCNVFIFPNPFSINEKLPIGQFLVHSG